MSMNVGEGSDDDVMVDMNTTPLIDVLLVLIVMLILSIPVQTHAVKMDMPVGTPPPKRLSLKKSILWLTSMARYYGTAIMSLQVS